MAGIRTIADLNLRTDLTLVTNSQDVEQAYYYMGMPPKQGMSLFVKIEDGEYSEVYEFEGEVPFLNKSVEQIK
jgi:hypothetical protein